jgi:plasmid stabilization system protein ParE
MQVRWTSAAADDLENIANYLFEKTPENAGRLIREIYDVPSTLKSFPNRGRPGKKQGTPHRYESPFVYKGDAMARHAILHFWTIGCARE